MWVSSCEKERIFLVFLLGCFTTGVKNVCFFFSPAALKTIQYLSSKRHG